MTIDDGVGAQVAVADAVARVGGCVLTEPTGGSRIEAGLTTDQLTEVLHDDQVLFVDIPGEIEEDLNLARDVCGASYLEGVGGFLGDGVVTLDDLPYFDDCLAGPGETLSPDCESGADFDADGDVDLRDYSGFSVVIIMR